MSSCRSIRKKKRKVCVGDMRDPITIQNRNIKAPPFGSVNFRENFQDKNEVTPQTLSLIETVRGKVYFDGVSTETPVSHHVYIMFDPEVTSESWIIFEGRRLDILLVEDLDERHVFQLLTCTDTGLSSKEGSKT